MNLFLDVGTEDSEDTRNTMPTGRVVGIVQRNWKDYVASFAKDEVTFNIVCSNSSPKAFK